jgi:hypothetical protein
VKLTNGKGLTVTVTTDETGVEPQLSAAVTVYDKVPDGLTLIACATYCFGSVFSFLRNN